jgi:hypothetical protein
VPAIESGFTSHPVVDNRHTGDMSRHMTIRTTVRLPEDLVDRAKRKATAEGRTLSSVIEDGLRSIVAEIPKTTKQKRTLPRISKATGGAIPGIDLDNSAMLQDTDDADYFVRTRTS